LYNSLDKKPSKIYPNFIAAEVGSVQSFLCESKYKSLWLFENHLIPSNAITNEYSGYTSLAIHKVVLENYGRYKCYGWDDSPFIAEAMLKVYGKCS